MTGSDKRKERLAEELRANLRRRRAQARSRREQDDAAGQPDTADEAAADEPGEPPPA